MALFICGSRGGRGRGPYPPLKNHKNIGFLSNTGPDPLKNHKAIKPALNVEPTSHDSETPFTTAKRHLNGVSLAGR